MESKIDFIDACSEKTEYLSHLFSRDFHFDLFKTYINAKLAIEGGVPIRRTPWPTYDKGAVFVNKRDEKAALRAIRSHLYFRYDFRSFENTECGKFEKILQNYFKVKHALSLSSGTAALAIALMAAGVPKDAFVACPGFTFVATPSAIHLAGCRPFLIEVDENLHFDLDHLRRKWTPAIKAILVVHMRGFASDLEKIMDFADEVGVPVIEDAVPALGVDYKGKKLGTFGVAGAFSTQSDKSLNTGEGGFLLTNDSELYMRAAALSGAYESCLKKHFPYAESIPLDCFKLPLLNFRMDEIRAALACSEMNQLNVRLDKFLGNYQYIAEHLAPIPEIKIRQPVASNAFLGESLIFRLPELNAEYFAKALCAEGIDARNLGSENDSNVRCFWNWGFMFNDQDPLSVKNTLPRTYRFLKQAVDIPLSSTLTKEDCNQLIAAVYRILRHIKESQ